MEKTTNRIEGLDIIRSFAIFCVVLIHSVRCVAPLDSIEDFHNLSWLAKIFNFSMFTVGAIGVPLFFLLSGYLLLSREYDAERTKKFYKNNLIPLLITWEIWIFIYNWLDLWYYNIPFEMGTLLRNLLFVEMVYVGHSWYMPVILGMYLFIPYVARALKTMRDSEIISIFIIAFIYLFIVPTADKFTIIYLHGCLDLSFSGGIYGLYIISGYLIRRYEQKLKRSFALILMAIIAIILTVKAQIFITKSTGSVYHIWYEFCLIPFAAAAIFIFFKDLKCRFFKNIITNISKCSFGIYLTHVITIAIILKFQFLDFIGGVELKMLILTFAAFIISFAFVKISAKIPSFSKILFRI